MKIIEYKDYICMDPDLLMKGTASEEYTTKITLKNCDIISNDFLEYLTKDNRDSWVTEAKK